MRDKRGEFRCLAGLMLLLAGCLLSAGSAPAADPPKVEVLPPAKPAAERVLRAGLFGIKIPNEIAVSDSCDSSSAGPTEPNTEQPVVTACELIYQGKFDAAGELIQKHVKDVNDANNPWRELSQVVQRALLPQSIPSLPGVDLAAFNRPAQIINFYMSRRIFFAISKNNESMGFV